MKLRKVHLEIRESCLFQKREYTVIPATQEQQDKLIEKYGTTELHPKSLIQAIISTASMGCGFATSDDERGMVIKMQNVTNRPEFQFIINSTTHEWEAPPVHAEIIKAGSKKFTGKGDVWAMMAEGRMIKDQIVHAKPETMKFKYTKEEIHRGDAVKWLNNEGEKQSGIVINVIKPLNSANYFKVRSRDGLIDVSEEQIDALKKQEGLI